MEAVIGAADWITVLWTPRVKRAAEVAATIFCQNDSLVTFGGGVMNVRATMDYQITQGELRQARVQLPAGQKLLRVEGTDIRTWETGNENGAQVLIVDLLKSVSPSWRLTIETEQVLDALPANVVVGTPRALDVKRESGLVALRGTEELALSVESASGLERVDAEEFVSAGADKAGNLSSVFRYSVPGFALRVRAEAIQPEIEAVARNNFRVSAEQVALSAVVDYTIKRAGVFTLKVALPDGYRVERVTGNNIQQRAERNDGSRVLEITLKERTSGAYTLGIELARDFKELPKSLAVAGVHPLGAAKLTGFVAVSAEPGVAVKMESFDGLTEIPAVSLPDYAMVAGTGNVLAYKFISSAPKSAADWKLSVTTESVAAWVRAEIINTFTLTETLVSGRALVRYDIANAPVKELRVRVPAEFKNVEITGTNIRSKEQISGGTVTRVLRHEFRRLAPGIAKPDARILHADRDVGRAARGKNSRAGTHGDFRRRRGARDRPAGDPGKGAVAGRRIQRGGFAARGRGGFSRLGGKPGQHDGARVSLRAAGLQAHARRAAV